MVDKNTIFGGMLTTLGANKKTNCDALGIPWEPKYMLIGDANGTDPVPSPSQTRLINQVYKAQLNQLRVSEQDANVLIAELVLPPDVGGWWIRELALEDKDGVFCAVSNVAPSYKPLLEQNSGRNQVVRMHIITNGTSNIQLKIDPSVVLATRQYVDDSIKNVLPVDKAPGEFTRVKVNSRGVVTSGDNPDTLAGLGIKDSYTKAEIEAIIAQASALPVGATVAFPLDKVAPGFLELDGSVKSIAAYPDLAAFLGTAFNKGDEGAGNFRLPESRGEFLRGWDHGRGVDAGRLVGSWQADEFKSHVHQLDSPANPTGFGQDKVARGNRSDSNGTPLTTATGGTETRPRNLAVIWCIKAWNAPINQGNIDIAALTTIVEQLSIRGAMVGASKARMNVSVASANATFTADEVILQDAGGKSYRIKAFSQTVNLASALKGLGAMDVGGAPASGYVALYALYNPATNARSLMAVNATATVAPELYSGANAPAGFSASALLTVVPTDSGGNLVVCSVEDRMVTIGAKLIFTGAASVTNGPIPLASTVPPNAVRANGLMGLGSSGVGTVSMDIYSLLGGVGLVRNTATVSTAGGLYTHSFSNLAIIAQQSWWVSASNAASGTPVFNAFITSYFI
ncbi:phage tail protein [Pseudomonas frederiksbergensis]|uniref:phage tail protein n=1 Tax=Pseudomonas frederiksbergensis TaxID=104087 RepID=UPI002DBF4542|nr:phage tail protein [Pseudomonas frederiksbergensis]WRV66585.1 phage tail protein [Pseudomonas frederiksbergensis]